MKLTLTTFATLLSLSLSAPAKLDGSPVLVLRDDSQAPLGANYHTTFELDNGISVDEQGSAGSAGQANVQGSYSYISPEGVEVVVSYIADENGFQASGPFIPTPPPAPEHTLLQIRFAEEQARNQQ